MIRKLALTLAICAAVLTVLPASCATHLFARNFQNPEGCSRMIGRQLARIGNRVPGEYELGKPYNPPRYELTVNLRIDDSLYCALLELELR